MSYTVQIGGHKYPSTEIRMPYKVQFVAPDPETGKPYTFAEVFAGLDTCEVRQQAHSQHNAEITAITAVDIEKYCIFEHDANTNVVSIIYTTDDEMEAAQTLAKLRSTWATGSRYKFELLEV